MTTDQKQLAAIIFGALLLVLLTCMWFWGYDRGRRSVKCPSVQTDTIVRVDTIVYDRPVEITKWREKTVYIAVTDTQIVRTTDSVYVALEREKKSYSGEDYTAIVSGIEPSLDEIKVFPKTVTITNTVTDKRRWTFGITAGPGVLWDGSFHGGMGIVAGLQYRF